MAVFPFTVRATDSEGSYADRQFSITVRNTRVERFMILNSTDAYTSPDGTTWSKQVGAGGQSCAYGNGFWLIMKVTSSTANVITGINKSTDGINYSYTDVSSMTFVDESNVATSAPIFGQSGGAFAKLKFWNGKFYFMSLAASSFNIWSSADGIAWKRQQLFSGSAYAPATNVLPYLSLSEDSGSLIIPLPGGGSTTNMNPSTNTAMGWITNDGVNFTPIKNAALTSANQYAWNLTRINGLYLAQYASPIGSGPSANFLYSTDGLNWSQGTITSSTGTIGSTHKPGPMFYANGVIYSFGYKIGTSSAAGVVYTSVDGISWSDVQYKTYATSTTLFNVHYLFKNGLFLAQGDNANSSATFSNDATLTTASSGARVSIDGTSFTPVNIGSGTSYVFNDVGAM